MKPKTMILMVVAVTCGLGASYMTSRLLAERSHEQDTPKVAVLVAQKNLDLGMTVKNPQELFHEKLFTQGEEPKNGIRNYDEIKGRILRRALRQGDWVSMEDFLSDKDPGMGGWLPQGYRAVGLRVNIESIAGGFASLPHSRVDIISTVRRGDDRSSYSQVLLENVLVLAADQNPIRDDSGRAMPANVVTVALKPKDSLKVHLAKEMGPLSLVLRKINDTSKSEVGKITVEQINTRAGGRSSEIVEGGSEGTETSPVTGLPPLPKTQPKVVAQAPVVEKEDPSGVLHRLRIIEGDKERSTDYLLDEEGNVINQEVQRTDLPPVPRPAAQAPRPAASTPPAPAPKNSDKEY